MASSSFSESSGASLAALLLLVAVLVGSLALGAQAQTVFELEVDNELDDGFRSNDVTCIITASQLVGGSAVSFFVPAQGSNSVPLQATQSLSSPKFIVEVYGKGPLGAGCSCCRFLPFRCQGKIYSTSGDFLQRLASLLGYRIEIVGNCGTDNQPALQLDGYVASNVKIATTCAQLDPES